MWPLEIMVASGVVGQRTCMRMERQRFRRRSRRRSRTMAVCFCRTVIDSGSASALLPAPPSIAAGATAVAIDAAAMLALCDAPMLLIAAHPQPVRALRLLSVHARVCRTSAANGTGAARDACTASARGTDQDITWIWHPFRVV